MTFYFTKISGHGTSHPIYARIDCGLGEIVQLVTLSKDSKNRLNNILYDLSQDMITAENRATELVAELDEIEAQIESQPNEKSTVPNTIESSLKLFLARDFLKYTNNSLRLLTGFFDICFQIGNKQTKLQNVIKALQKLNPVPEALLDHLIRTEPWYKTVVDLRGTDEHKVPNKPLFKNYSIESNKEYSYLKRPAFSDGTNVHSFLKCSLEYLLPFFELALVFTLSYCLPDPIAIIEIPENQRDPKFPRRFRLDIA